MENKRLSSKDAPSKWFNVVRLGLHLRWVCMRFLQAVSIIDDYLG
jgi:hypothetical protein